MTIAEISKRVSGHNQGIKSHPCQSFGNQNQAVAILSGDFVHHHDLLERVIAKEGLTCSKNKSCIFEEEVVWNMIQISANDLAVTSVKPA